MIEPRLFSDLLAWSAQLACIALAGGLLPSLLRIDAAGVRYAYFRALLALGLLLPWTQGRQAVSDSFTTTAVIGLSVVEGSGRAGSAALSAFPWLEALAVLIVAGMAVRALLIIAGLLHLRRWRHAGWLASSSTEHDELQRLLGTSAEIRFVAGLRQPVTFGLRHPLVLLPESLQEHPAPVQRAVLTHELLHVRRRDWLWLLIEESIRAALWFHPGVWWLVSHIQLAREEVVDELTVLATGTRRAYIEALAAFADETPLVPAAAFARRRHLFRRMRLIAREGGMSSRRIAWSCALMALVVAAGSWLAVVAFPLTTAAAQNPRNGIGPLEKQAKPITPENPIPRRTYFVEPVYPAEAAAVDANAMVTMLITLEQSGRVAELRHLSVAPVAQPASTSPPDPKALAAAFNAMERSAADAVRQWLYEPPAEPPISIRVTIAFASAGVTRLVAHDGWSVAYPGQSAGFGAPPPPPPPPPPRPQERRRVDGVLLEAWYDDGIRVGGDVLQPVKTRHVNPSYPEVAQSARVQGVVIIEARIGVDGKVTNARVLRSVPLLDQAALDAVMQWEFTPTQLNGQLVPVVTTITVRFTLT